MAVAEVQFISSGQRHFAMPNIQIAAPQHNFIFDVVLPSNSMREDSLEFIVKSLPASVQCSELEFWNSRHV